MNTPNPYATPRKKEKSIGMNVLILSWEDRNRGKMRSVDRVFKIMKYLYIITPEKILISINTLI